MDELANAAVLAKKLESQSENLIEAVAFLHDVVGGKLRTAERQNEFFYNVKVPDRESLPEIKGVSLVKCIPFDIHDPEIAGRDIFHALLPLEDRKASSLYRFHLTELLFYSFPTF